MSVWGKQAESCNQYLAKGRMVLVEGEINEPQVYQRRDGEWAASLDVRAAAGVPPGAPLILYTGTFEAYQGLDLLFAKIMARLDGCTVAEVVKNRWPDHSELLGYLQDALAEIKRLPAVDGAEGAGTPADTMAPVAAAAPPPARKKSAPRRAPARKSAGDKPAAAKRVRSRAAAS